MGPEPAFRLYRSRGRGASCARVRLRGRKRPREASDQRPERSDPRRRPASAGAHRRRGSTRRYRGDSRPARPRALLGRFGRLQRRVRISSRDHSKSAASPRLAAIVALKLVAQGKIRLELLVEKWLPGLVRNGEQITVHQLLNMTSGLADYCAVPPDSTLCTPSPGNGPSLGPPAPGHDRGLGPCDLRSRSRVVVHQHRLRPARHDRREGHREPIEAEYQRKIFGPLGLHSTRSPPAPQCQPPTAAATT